MEVGYMRKDENCFCFERNVSFFKSVHSLNFYARLAYSLLFLYTPHTTFFTIPLLVFYDCRTILYPVLEKNKFWTLD